MPVPARAIAEYHVCQRLLQAAEQVDGLPSEALIQIPILLPPE